MHIHRLLGKRQVAIFNQNSTSMLGNRPKINKQQDGLSTKHALLYEMNANLLYSQNVSSRDAMSPPCQLPPLLPHQLAAGAARTQTKNGTLQVSSVPEQNHAMP